MKRIESWDSFVASPEDQAYDCLLKFEANKCGTVLVLKNKTVIGTVSDGDVRKALIQHRMLNIPLKQIMNLHYLSGKNHDECNKIFQNYSYINLVPIVDDERALVDIYSRS